MSFSRRTVAPIDVSPGPIQDGTGLAVSAQLLLVGAKCVLSGFRVSIQLLFFNMFFYSKVNFFS